MSMILAPRVTEKSIALAEIGIYVFDVPTQANKIEIAKAVEATFKVDVINVNIVIAKGKLKMFKQKPGRQHDIKKALVKVKAGQSISLFEGAN